MIDVVTVELRGEHDVVLARQRAREVAAALGFDGQEQTRIATAASEISRNAFRYAKGGKVVIQVDDGTHELVFSVTDRGPGIADLEHVMSGRYRSTTGMGMGIMGAKKLMDRFEISSSPSGTLVTFAKRLTRLPPGGLRAAIDGAVREIEKSRDGAPLAELERQNHDLLVALETAREQREQLKLLNDELEQTNRGVVALYAELDERADYLQRISDIKSGFLSNMTHEFRTPLNSILSLSRILLDRLDGELSAEQEKQIRFIQSSAEALSELTNDLLDLAKVEAGKIVVRRAEFRPADLFSALRGVLKPLLTRGTGAAAGMVELVFEVCDDLPPMHSDEAKVSQILRNFISNAIKYTERGEVRVSARLTAPGRILFAVKDSGIGIAPEHHATIFQEFTQIDSPQQRQIKGTGLGLPLSRRLARILGGDVRVDSKLGEGATFTLELPIELPDGVKTGVLSQEPPAQGSKGKLLIIDDDQVARYLLRGLLVGVPYEIEEATSGEDGIIQARRSRPRMIFLDLRMPDRDGFSVLEQLKREPGTRDIPVVIHTSKDISDDDRTRLSAAVAIVPKDSGSRQSAITNVRAALRAAGVEV